MTVNGKLFVGAVAAVCCAAWCAIGLGTCTAGCASSFDPLAYAQAQSDCVATARSRAEADACRAAVRERFGLATDGGAHD